jgi:hypothetical protein
MNFTLALIVAAIAAVAYSQGLLTMPDIQNMGTMRNLVIVTLGAVVAYYLYTNAFAAPPKPIEAAPKKSHDVLAVRPGSVNDVGYAEAYEEPMQDEDEEEGEPDVPGNFLDGSSKHEKMFEQQVHSNLPYMVGSTVAPPEPGPLKRSFLSKDLRPAPLVTIDENQSIPFGMSSVAAVVSQAGDAMIYNKDVGIAKCI